MPRSSDLRTFACGPIKLELRRRSQLGLCQRRKLVCHQDVWVHILTEYRMNVCRVTCIIHVQSSFVFIILLFSLFFFYFSLLTHTYKLYHAIRQHIQYDIILRCSARIPSISLCVYIHKSQCFFRTHVTL